MKIKTPPEIVERMKILMPGNPRPHLFGMKTKRRGDIWRLMRGSLRFVAPSPEELLSRYELVKKLYGWTS